MPEYDGSDIGRHGWAADLTRDWFYKGLSEASVPKPKDGIDRDMALRHISTVLRSWEPSHQHKMEAVAKLFANWFEEPSK